MADPTTKTFTDLVAGQAAAQQARSAGLADYSIGSILRAFGEAVSGVALWLQGLFLVLMATRYASTSQGADLDSWYADFGAAPLPGDETIFARLPAMAASGSQTFSRVSTGGVATVPIGATVQTADGSQKYVVTLDPTNPAYNSGLGGYTMTAGIGSVACPIQALTVGAAGNVVANAINTITSAIPGVSATTNAAGLSNGADAETDAQMRARFPDFIASREAGTPRAIKFAVTSLQRGMACVVVENTHFDGSTEKGYTTVLVDDGTGFPSGAILTAAAAAVDAIHAAGNPFACFAPVVVPISAAAGLVTVAGANHAAAVTAATQALQTYLNTLPIAATVYWSRVWQVLQDASPDILEVTGLSVNGGSLDIAMSFKQVAKAGTLTVS